MKSPKKHTAIIGAALLSLVWAMSVAGIAAGVAPVNRPTISGQADDKGRVAGGQHLFRTYCASCHGTSARGDGPLAASMRRQPANLTEIAKRNGGVYPSEMVDRVIDGRQQVRGHGGPDMPVWGDAFLRTTDGGSEATVRLKIQALVAYLDSIQARQGF